MGALLAYTLLLLYSFPVFYYINAVRISGQGTGEAVIIPEGMVYVVTTIGGLISALVVARLTITPPKENVGEYKNTRMPSKLRKIAKFLTFLYLAIWMFTGLAALVYGVMLYPDINNTLRDIGTSWFGLAVTSVYTYFGLEPTIQNSQGS